MVFETEIIGSSLNDTIGTITDALKSPVVAGVGGAIGGAVIGGVVTSAIIKRRKKKSNKRKYSKSRNSKSLHKRKRKTPRTAGKRKDRSTKRIRYTKRGQPYVILANGRARFISNKSAKISRRRKGGRY